MFAEAVGLLVLVGLPALKRDRRSSKSTKHSDRNETKFDKSILRANQVKKDGANKKKHKKVFELFVENITLTVPLKSAGKKTRTDMFQ